MERLAIIKIILASFLILLGCVVIYLPTFYKNSSAPDLACAKVIFDTGMCNRVKNDYTIIGVLIVLAGIVCLFVANRK